MHQVTGTSGILCFPQVHQCSVFYKYIFPIFDIFLKRWISISACTNPPNIASLGSLTAGVSCHITDTCTGVSCCLDPTTTSQPIRAYLTIDSCDYKLKVGIERLYFELSLFDYQMGTTRFFKLYGVVGVEYNIYDLSSEGVFVVNLKIKVCFDPSGACDYDFTVFSDMKLNKPVCDYGGDFKIASEYGFILSVCWKKIICRRKF